MKRILLPLLVLAGLLGGCATTDQTASRSPQITNPDGIARAGPQANYSGQGSDSQMFTPPPGISTSSSSP